jgi:hypothetical protein
MAIVSRTATVVENSSASSITGSLPSDRVTGDLAIAVFSFSGSGTVTGPAGWTQFFAPVSLSGVTLAAYYRISPPAAPTASTSASADRCSVVCQSYGNVNQGAPIDVAAVVTQGPATNTTLVTTGLTVATAGARLVAALAGDASTRTITIPSGMTLVKSYSAAPNGRLLGVADEVRAATGATGTRSWTIAPSVTIDMIGFVVAIAPQTGLSLSGSISASGTLRKVTTKNFFTASITATGAFSKLKVVFRMFDGSTAPTGVLVKLWHKNFTGAIASNGIVGKLLSRTFVSSITATGFFRKAFVRRFTGSIATTGNVVITFLGRAFGLPGRAAVTIEKAGDALIRVRRK